MIYAVAPMAFCLLVTHYFGSWDNDSMSKWAAFLFQMAFVGKSVNIMSGGVSERTKLIPLTIFTVAMAAVIYPLVVNFTWGANILKDTLLDISAMHDLAGSTVIHSTGAWALLAAILVIGSRKGRYVKGKVKVIPASNIPLVTLGGLVFCYCFCSCSCWSCWFNIN